MSYRVTIPGEPVGKGRPRAAATRAGVRMYTPARTVAWERGAAYVMRQAHSGPPLTGPLAIEVVALHGRPQRLDCEHKRQPCSCDDDWLAATAGIPTSLMIKLGFHDRLAPHESMIELQF